MEIKSNHVYINDAGEQRLVMSPVRSISDDNTVVVWRTADWLLPDGVKSQGSATMASFRKWPTSMRKATDSDRRAFSYVESTRKELAKAKRRRKAMRSKKC